MKKENTWGKPKKKSYKYNIALEDKIISKINDLYISTRWKYLVLKSDGDYITAQKPKLSDKLIRQHLRGKQTIGVFGGEFRSKFICFDIDGTHQIASRTLALRLHSTLISVGIPEERIYWDYSGKKGYHATIFLTDYIDNKKIKQFYNLVLHVGQLDSETLENEGFGKIELKPEGATYGLKIPLGVHFGNEDNKNNKCLFINIHNDFKLIKDEEYILSIEKLDKEMITNILDEYDYIFEKLKIKPKKKSKQVVEDITQEYKPLEIYNQNIDEDYTIESIIKLINEGLTIPSTRHNSLLKIAKYFKCEMGLDNLECEKELINWLKCQDTKYYKTPWEECLEDIKEIVDYIYSKNIQLTVSKRLDVDISKEEMDEIMKCEDKIDKVLLYAMVIHSKRYATKEGVFFMTYEQMKETTGIGSNMTIHDHINVLQQLDKIKIVSRRNVVRDNEGNYVSMLPNQYKIKINIETKSEFKFTVINGTKDYKDMYYKNVCLFYTNKELKSMVPERQLREIRKYRNSMVA